MLLRPAFNPKKPTALFIGRYQTFHAGHQRLIEEGLRRIGQVCVAVRDTHGVDVQHRCGVWHRDRDGTLAAQTESFKEALADR